MKRFSQSSYARVARQAFTLIELLVVITIIGILISLLLPAVQSAREAARRAQCMNHLKQLSLACLTYEAQNRYFPPAISFDAGQDATNSGNFRPNWVGLLLPFMEQQALYNSINRQNYLSDATNKTYRSTVLEVMICPTDTGHDDKCQQNGGDWARGNYAANVGNQRLNDFNGGTASAGWQNTRRRGVMGLNAACTIAQIKDGTSNTLLLSEVRVGLHPIDRRGTWAMGTAGASALSWFGCGGDDNGINPSNDNSDDIQNCNDLPQAIKDRLMIERMSCWLPCPSYQAAPRSRHAGGVHAAFADGSVHFLSENLENGGPWGDCNNPRLWDHLIGSADGVPFDASKLGL